MCARCLNVVSARRLWQVQQLVKQLADAEIARDELEARLAAASSGAAEGAAQTLGKTHGDHDGPWSLHKVPHSRT